MQDQLLKIYARAWEELDTSILAPYLSKDFSYGSMFVISKIHGKEQFLKYLKGKLDSIKHSNYSVVVSIKLSPWSNVQSVHLLQDGKNGAFIEIETEENFIKSAYMFSDEGKNQASSSNDWTKFDASEFEEMFDSMMDSYKPKSIEKQISDCPCCGSKLKPVCFGEITLEIQQLKNGHKIYIGEELYGKIETKNTSKHDYVFVQETDT